MFFSTTDFTLHPLFLGIICLVAFESLHSWLIIMSALKKRGRESEKHISFFSFFYGKLWKASCSYMHAFSYKLINKEKLWKQYTSLEYTNNEQNKGKTVSSSLKLQNKTLPSYPHKNKQQHSYQKHFYAH